MFDQLAGNNHFKETVKKMLHSNRLVHSIILEGGEGIGKHTAASIISAAAICESSNAPCGVCRKCKLCAELKHTDIHIFSPTGNVFSVKTVRDNIKVEAYIKPLEANRKVFILENTELMNTEAQNAMLKILEEPPESVIFVLLVTHAAKLLPTIQSRCLTICLREPEPEEAVNFLLKTTEFKQDEVEVALEETDYNIGKAKLILANDSSDAAHLTAENIFTSLKTNRLQLLKIFHSEIGSKKDYALKVTSELELIIMKNIKKASKGEKTDLPLEVLVELLTPLKFATECVAGNCNIPLTFTVLAEEFFDTLQRRI